MNPLTQTRNMQKMNQKELELGLSDTNSSWHNGYKDSAWIFVGGLPYDLTEGDVITVFSQYGEIVNINMVRDKITGKQKGYAFICYEDQRSTVLAVDNLNSIKLLNRTLRVDHVMNYKVPEIKGDEDELTKKIRMEGCAPEVKVEKLAKKLKKEEEKVKGDGVTDEEKSQKIKCERNSESRVEDTTESKPFDFRHYDNDGKDSKPKIKVEVNDSEPVDSSEIHLPESRSPNNGCDKNKSTFDREHQYSKARSPTKRAGDNITRSPKRKRSDGIDKNESPFHNQHEAEPKRHRRHCDDNRSSMYERRDTHKSQRRDRTDDYDDHRSSRYRKHYDDDYRSSKYRRDDKGHRSPYHSRRDR